jgi:hypothetical protein
MKTQVTNYIYDNLNERGLKEFEKKVAKILKTNCITNHITCHDAYMQRANGRGSYYKIIVLEIDNNYNEIIIKLHTNDSVTWDNWYQPTQKNKRDLFLGVLSTKINELYDLTTNIENDEN